MFLGVCCLLSVWVFPATGASRSVAGTARSNPSAFDQAGESETRRSRHRPSAKDSAKKEKGKKAKGKDKDKTTEEESSDLFLPEAKENQEYLPDLYRCPECGYEQDEPGNCPDHDEMPLVLILSQGKNPLEPAEVDGNEDLLVDMPLSGLTLKKAVEPGTATATVSPKKAEQRTPPPN